MPIYEYRCRSCNKLFEEWVKHFDAPEAQVCPECGAAAERIMSKTSFVLEGSGWYVTEYGNRKTNHESGAGAPGEGHPEKAADSSADASSASPATAASTSSGASPQSAGSAESSSASSSASGSASGSTASASTGSTASTSSSESA